MLLGLPELSAGDDPSTFAAEAAVGAVAAAGRRTGRVGDLGRDLVDGCFGDVDSVFLTCCAVELPDNGAGFEGFEDAGFEAADDRLVGFFMSLAGPPFASLGGCDFGDVLWGVDCLPGTAVALVGVRGPGEVVFWPLLFDASVALEAAGEVPDCIPTSAGSPLPVGLLSGTFGDFEGSGGEVTLVPAEVPKGAALGLVCCAGFDDSVSLDFPLTVGLAEALLGFLGDRDVAAATVDFGGLEGLALSAFSCSNGEPFSIDPSSVVSLPRAAPPDTTASSLGSEGSILAVPSSAEETGLSGFASDEPSVAPGFVSTVGDPCLGSFVDSTPDLEAFAEVDCTETPLDWGLFGASPSAAAFDPFTPASTTASLPIVSFIPS